MKRAAAAEAFVSTSFRCGQEVRCDELLMAIGEVLHADRVRVHALRVQPDLGQADFMAILRVAGEKQHPGLVRAPR